MTGFDRARWAAELPVGHTLPAVDAALASHGAAVLQAPPGAGKTTLVPLALRDAAWLREERIVMLEPRRLATRAAARRMAEMCGEAVGDSVGYRTRLDTKIGPRTRIEVVTEGILLRQLQRDPELAGIGLLIFDEFHERSLDADLGLALAIETRRYLRDDLRLLVMSATLDGTPVAGLLGDAPIVTSESRSHPVAVRYLERPPLDRLERAMAAAIRQALEQEAGSILAFLPGGGEIRRVERFLMESGLPNRVTVAPLYGDLPQPAQDAAIHPAPAGQRKIVLATSIAETSLTIEGIRVVIDSGWRRVPRFEPQSGMTRLVTVRVSQAAAEQRRGRAGRLAPGICFRLWREAEQLHLPEFDAPEIRQADLAPLALELARWGTVDAETLAWLDPPPAAALAQARELLRSLGALDKAAGITAHGRAMATLGVHPRLAHMMLIGRERGRGRLACIVAALLGERDIVKNAPRQSDADLRLRVEAIAARRGAEHLPAGATLDRGAAERVRESARQYARLLGVAGDDEIRADETGRVLAQAYPDRIGRRRADAAGQFRLSNGRGAELPETDPLAAEEFLAVAEVDGERRSARIFQAAPVSRAELIEDFGAAIEAVETIAWDEREAAVQARRQQKLGSLVLRDERLTDPPPDLVVAALLDGIKALGLSALAWSKEAASLRARVAFVRRHLGEPETATWPDLSDEALLDGLETWLAPFLAGITRRGQLAAVDVAAPLRAQLSYAQKQTLDRLAPTHAAVPSGSIVPIDYEAGDVPVLAVRLQELFGAGETPTVAGGRVPLLLQLLSPAGRPLQVTRDLKGFWTSSYPAVRSEMRGRYPKHPWPEDPTTATPTARAKPRAAAPATGARR
jgi:ATP-dependent helicase HrpB